MKTILRKQLFLLLGLLSSIRVFAQFQPSSIEDYKLKNGMEVRLIPFGTIPAITATCYINVGQKTETPGMQYLSNLVADGILLGNEKFARIDQDNAVTKLGGKITSSVNSNYTEVEINFLNKDAATAFELFSSALLKPLFPESEMQQKIEEALTYNNPRKADINALASIYSDYVVFGSANPLGRHYYASQLDKITSAQIKDFYKFYYTPKNTKLVLAGNFDKAQMKTIIEKYFGSWNAEMGENNSAQYDEPIFDKKQVYFINKNKATQTYFQWTKKAPESSSKDLLAFRLANEEFSKLLFEEIREKEGKTYGIYSTYDITSNKGIYTIATQVRTEVAYATIISFDRVLKEFYEKGITQEQLQRAKNTYKSSYLAIETPVAITGFYNPILYKDVSKRNEYITNIDAITLEQVNKIIKKYFQPTSYKLVMVGNAKDLQERTTKISDLTELSYTDIEKDN